MTQWSNAQRWQRTRRAAASLAAVVLLASCSSDDGLRINVADAAVVTAQGPLLGTQPYLDVAMWGDVAAWAAREVEVGRPVVINLFASWCGPCRAEAPLLRRAVAAHPDVAFLLVDHLDKRDEGEAFLIDEALDHLPSVFDDLGDVAGALQARGMPATAFFSAQGDLVGVVNGVLTEPVLAQRLADLKATMGPR